MSQESVVFCDDDDDDDDDGSFTQRAVGK